MLMELRQSFGRLIRKTDDKGIFILADRRFLAYNEALDYKNKAIANPTFKNAYNEIQNQLNENARIEDVNYDSNVS